MATPDRFPGDRQESKIILDTPPSAPGEIGYNSATGKLQGQDATSTFDLGPAGASYDEKVKVSANDTTPGYLDSKLVAGPRIALTEQNDGGNESLLLTVKPVLELSWQPIEIGEDVYTALTHFLFRGTSYLGTPQYIKMIGWCEDDTEPVDVRIVDITHAGAVIAEGQIATETVGVFDMGTLSNLPVGESVFEIQAKKYDSRAAAGWLHAMSVQW